MARAIASPLFWFVTVTTFSTAAGTLPTSPREDRHHALIDRETYTMKKNTPVWHGSTYPEIDLSKDELAAIWFAEYSTNSLSAAMTKANKERKEMIYLYLFKNNEDLTLINLLHKDSKANTKLLNKKFPVPSDDEDSDEDSDEESDFEDKWPITMGKPSDRVKPYLEEPKNQLAVRKTTTLCRDYAGWRSPWDQDEFMICPKDKTKMIRQSKFECKYKELEAYLVQEVEPTGQIGQPKKVVTEGKTLSYTGYGTEWYKTGEQDKTKEAQIALPLTYDTQLKGAVNIRKLVDGKLCRLVSGGHPWPPAKAGQGGAVAGTAAGKGGAVAGKAIGKGGAQGVLAHD